MKFYGYRRADGSVGCRNLVAVIPSVVCAADVAQAIVQNVQGAVGLFHHQGCSQLPPDLKRVTDTLIGLALNPNVGAVLIVSLGCEGTDHARILESRSLAVLAKLLRPVLTRLQAWYGKSLVSSGRRQTCLRLCFPSSVVRPMQRPAWHPTVRWAMRQTSW